MGFPFSVLCAWPGQGDVELIDAMQRALIWDEARDEKHGNRELLRAFSAKRFAQSKDAMRGANCSASP